MEPPDWIVLLLVAGIGALVAVGIVFAVMDRLAP
jgi:hypothetical protein